MTPKHQPVYRILLKDAALLTWQQKHLWLFGFFLALGGQSGVYDVLLRNWNAWLDRGLELASGPLTWPRIPEVGLGATTLPPGLILLSLATILIAAIVIFMGVVSLGATIWTARKTARGGRAGIREAWAVGLKSFWPLLLITALTYVLLNVIFVVVAWPTVLLATRGTLGNIIIFILGYAIFLPLGLAVAFGSFYTSCGIVLHGHGVPDAVAHASHTLRKNIVLSLELGGALFICSIVFSIATIVVAVAAAFPFLLGLALTFFSGAYTAALIFLVLAAVVFVVITVLAGSYLMAYQVVAWTLLYQKITDRGAMPKLVRILHRFVYR